MGSRESYAKPKFDLDNLWKHARKMRDIKGKLFKKKRGASNYSHETRKGFFCSISTGLKFVGKAKI